MIETAAVVASTSWGTVLAVLLARNGIRVRLCAFDEADAGALRRDGENARLQPGSASLPRSVSPTTVLPLSNAPTSSLSPCLPLPLNL